jgi:hypothetical protein
MQSPQSQPRPRHEIYPASTPLTKKPRVSTTFSTPDKDSKKTIKDSNLHDKDVSSTMLKIDVSERNDVDVDVDIAVESLLSMRDSDRICIEVIDINKIRRGMSFHRSTRVKDAIDIINGVKSEMDLNKHKHKHDQHYVTKSTILASSLSSKSSEYRLLDQDGKIMDMHRFMSSVPAEMTYKMTEVVLDTDDEMDMNMNMNVNVNVDVNVEKN